MYINDNKDLFDTLRQHRTIHGTHLACILFRHIDQKSSVIHRVFPAVFGQSAEKSDCAICAPELCGVALIVNKEEIEAKLGISLIWDRLDGKKASRIKYNMPGLNFEDHSNYNELMNQIIDIAVRMRDVFKQYL